MSGKLAICEMAANKGEGAGENPPPRIAVQIKGELYKTEHRAQHM